MVIDHPDCLHESVANGRADKIEATFAEVLAHGIRLLSASGDLLQRFPFVYERVSADKLPDVGVKRPKLILDGQECFRIFHGGANLQPVSNDARIREQSAELP